MSPALLLVLLQQAPLGQAPRAPAPVDRAIIEVEHPAGVERWTVRTRACSPRALLTRVAALSGRTLEAEVDLAYEPGLTVALVQRSLDDVLEYALGSAGLRAEVDPSSIRVRADRGADGVEVETRAALAWRRLAAHHPRHPLSARALLAEGELAELRGRADDARRCYRELLRQAPASDAAREACWRGGRLAAERGDWHEAAELFGVLAGLAGADELRGYAQTELAHARLRLGDARGALEVLDDLDARQPCWEPEEFTARALVRIDALLAAGDSAAALEAIEGCDAELHPLGRGVLARLRARALEHTGQAEEASRAWVGVARDESASARAAAYRSAARLAEGAGDPLGVLFVAHEAERAGLASCVDEATVRARAALMTLAPAPAIGRASGRAGSPGRACQP